MADINIKGVIVSNTDRWIYDFFGVENTAPASVIKAVETARKSGERVDVYINSPGGDISAGADIYSALRGYSDVHIHITGQACSAASVIACAGRSDISPVGMVMIHNVSMAAEGDNRDMSHAATVLKTADKSIASAYVEKTGRSMEEMLGLMAKETWLTADEAVELGLVDEISAPATGAAPAGMKLCAAAIPLLPEKLLAEMRNKGAKARAELDLLKIRR